MWIIFVKGRELMYKCNLELSEMLSTPAIAGDFEHNSGIIDRYSNGGLQYGKRDICLTLHQG
jgi:hypothetical protein